MAQNLSFWAYFEPILENPGISGKLGAVTFEPLLCPNLTQEITIWNTMKALFIDKKLSNTTKNIPIKISLFDKVFNK